MCKDKHFSSNHQGFKEKSDLLFMIAKQEWFVVCVGDPEPGVGVPVCRICNSVIIFLLGMNQPFYQDTLFP